MFFSMSGQGQTRMQGLRGWANLSAWLQAQRTMIVRQFADGVAQALIDIFGRGGP
jgi:hypothetical protein